MKILGHLELGKYLVQMDEREIAQCCGYEYANDEFFKSLGDENYSSISVSYAMDRKRLKINVEININPQFEYLTKLKNSEEKCKAAAGTLRLMADIIGNQLPSAVIPPEPEPGEENETVIVKGDNT